MIICVGASVHANAQYCDLELVAQDESGHQNIPNFRYDSHHTASGHWQITDTNWRHYAPLVDIDVTKWPNALSAPEQMQGQVAGIMRARLGCLPWVPYNPQLKRDIGDFVAARNARSAPKTQPPPSQPLSEIPVDVKRPDPFSTESQDGSSFLITNLGENK